jgi:hypothetical protein
MRRTVGDRFGSAMFDTDGGDGRSNKNSLIGGRDMNVNHRFPRGCAGCGGAYSGCVVAACSVSWRARLRPQ